MGLAPPSTDLTLHRAMFSQQSSWSRIRTAVRIIPFFNSFKKDRYPWIQISGHQGNFVAGPQPGTILKRHVRREEAALEALNTDVLAPFVPRCMGTATMPDPADNNKTITYVQMQDLLCDLKDPCVMDIKMGVRTYLEDELEKAKRCPTPRKDMYEKMIEIDPSAPTDEEREARAVTKPRYMQFREEVSSSAGLGFRLEGVKKSDGTSNRDFKKTRTREQIASHLAEFTDHRPELQSLYLERLSALRTAAEDSTFLGDHEVIGSSLLFVHEPREGGRWGVWMIDFGKTTPLPKGVHLDHRSPWIEGNHEEGYLFGLDNLIDIFSSLHNDTEVPSKE